MKKKNDKIKILAWGDSPACATGFGTVMRNIFGYLGKTGDYEIDIIGINDRGGWKDSEKYPNQKIYPALPSGSNGYDYHGLQRFIGSIFGRDPEVRPSWDLIFTLNDPFVLDRRVHSGNGTMEMLVKAQLAYILQEDAEKWFKIVSYWPVDGEVKPNWVKDTMALPDVPVMYTHYGMDEMIRANNHLFENKISDIEERSSVIYHGYDHEHFFPITDKDAKEFRKEFFQGKVSDETFLISVIGRNQVRKDIPRALKVFAEFKKRRPDSVLYINAKVDDVWGDLKQYAAVFGLDVENDVLFPASFSPNSGLKLETLNKIYNTSDVILSTNIGEGFGLSYVEAMGAGTINAAPFHTTTPELFDLKNTDIDESARGISFKAGSTSSEWAFFGSDDLHRERPLSNVEDAVEKLTWIYDNPDKVKTIQDNASKWIKNYTWEKIAKEWDALFKATYKNLLKDRDNEKEIKDSMKARLGIKE